MCSLILRPMLALALIGSVLTASISPGQASLNIENSMEASVTARPGLGVYAYGSGHTNTITGGDDWNLGQFDKTMAHPVTNKLVLDLQWHLDDSSARKCWTLANEGPDAVEITEQPYRLELDTAAELAANRIQPDGADLRAIAVPVDENDPVVQLPLWVAGPMDRTDSAVWVQIDSIPVGVSEVCLYWNDPAAVTVSDENAVFTTAQPKPIYYTASASYTGAGASGTLNVASFVDDNTVVVDGVIQVIDAGEVAVFNGVDRHSVIAATGPISARGQGDATDSVVPINFAGTEFVFPTNRGVQQWSIRAPFGDADIEILNGNAVAWAGTVTEAGGTAHITADIGNNQSGLIQVTNDVPILVTHASRERYDAVVVPPYIEGQDIYGVRSRYLQAGFSHPNADATIRYSDNTVTVINNNNSGYYAVVDWADLDGNGTAARISGMNGPTAALQQADRDGLESTMFHPESLLANSYLLPTAADYIAFACPTPGIVITVGANDVTCSNANAGHPGHARILGAIPAGTFIESVNGEPFFAYYEDSGTDDETSLFGRNVHYLDSPSIPDAIPGDVILIDEDQPYEGIWTSAAIDASGSPEAIFGLLDHTATMPDGTSIEYQISTGPDAATATAGPFLGPDGTTDTHYADLEQPVGYHHDGDRFIVIKVKLATTNWNLQPSLDRITFGCDLVEPAADVGEPLRFTAPTVVNEATTSWIARIHPTPLDATSTATINHTTPIADLAPIATATLRTDSPSTQIVITNGNPNQAVGPPFVYQAHSIALDRTVNAVPAQIIATWAATDNAFRQERDLIIDIQ